MEEVLRVAARRDANGRPLHAHGTPPGSTVDHQRVAIASFQVLGRDERGARRFGARAKAGDGARLCGELAGALGQSRAIDRAPFPGATSPPVTCEACKRECRSHKDWPATTCWDGRYPLTLGCRVCRACDADECPVCGKEVNDMVIRYLPKPIAMALHLHDSAIRRNQPISGAREAIHGVAHSFMMRERARYGLPSRHKWPANEEDWVRERALWRGKTQCVLDRLAAWKMKYLKRRAMRDAILKMELPDGLEGPRLVNVALYWQDRYAQGDRGFDLEQVKKGMEFLFRRAEYEERREEVKMRTGRYPFERTRSLRTD